jgi:hypothetical protein
MNTLPKLLLPLTVAGALLSSGSVTAQAVTHRTTTTRYSTTDRWQDRAPDVRADFRTTPRWRLVSGTRVYVPMDTDLSYDLFRAGNGYYLYADNGLWYRANAWNGNYVRVDVRDVPSTIAMVPQAEWRSYPSEWANRDMRDDRSYGNRNSDDRYVRDYRNAPAAPRIVLRTAPRWRMVPNTRIYVATNTSTEYDLFRVGNAYYLYDDGYWYRGTRLNGAFVVTSEDRVPREFIRVPRSQWRHGPPEWANSRAQRESRSYR